MKRRILAAMPMISLLLFLYAGLYEKNWKLGWSFFLLIPISTMLMTGNFKRRLNESMPLICLVIFLVLGFGLDLWHPGWVVFLLIPITNLIFAKRLEPRKMVSFVITGAFIAIGLLTEQWHPAWIIFLLIPIINTIFFPEKYAYVRFNGASFKQKFKDIIEINPDEDEDK